MAAMRQCAAMRCNAERLPVNLATAGEQASEFHQPKGFQETLRLNTSVALEQPKVDAGCIPLLPRVSQAVDPKCDVFIDLAARVSF